ncbi:preprotein translocase subunit SecE [Candidatus Beckwithbacteria bacterium RBG_13_42_9]|uniref:Protein translocase subunit SecE n=1 Tax=Candidatus Beckwithbacteria bacterium RBG_13_42_9 TaxID=1797457 RepID=A0A1F5E6N4_9BACT|nr:MAG: preprotein translocase subunit SecE [Candidatus Beckwithbacteria bacterium RBG_13_42_9]
METPTLILPDFGKNPLEFLREARAELKKVIWPTKQEVMRMTILIVVVSVLVGAYVGGLDFGFTNLFRLLIQR